jgi:hypothetical protein
MRGDEANDKEVAAIRAALSSRRIHLSMIPVSSRPISDDGYI